MIRTVLVPLDGSERAESVLPYTEQIAVGTGSELVLLTAVYLSSAWGGWPVREDLGKATVAAQTYLESKRDELKSRGLKVKTVMAYQPQADSILNAAADEDADLIAMSTHGRSGMTRWISWSVADKVLHATHRPLLLVRATEPDYRKEAPVIQKILVPLDGSPLAEGVLPFVVGLAKALDASLELFHALPTVELHPGVEVGRLPTPELFNGLAAQANELLARVVKDVQKEGVKARGLFTIGPAVNEIVNAAEREGVGLIAMATHGRSGIGRWMIGSVADAVVRRTDLPCLVIRPEEVQQTRLND